MYKIEKRNSLVSILCPQVWNYFNLCFSCVLIFAFPENSLITAPPLLWYLSLLLPSFPSNRLVLFHNSYRIFFFSLDLDMQLWIFQNLPSAPAIPFIVFPQRKYNLHTPNPWNIDISPKALHNPFWLPFRRIKHWTIYKLLLAWRCCLWTIGIRGPAMTMEMNVTCSCKIYSAKENLHPASENSSLKGDWISNWQYLTLIVSVS